MKVGLAQIAPKLGRMQENLALHIAQIETAVEQEVDLLIFPELSLTGYLLRDAVPTVALDLTNKHDLTLHLLKQATLTHPIDVVVGVVEIDSRCRYYISSVYLSQGEIVHVHRKLYLPTYGIFEDSRFFGAGQEVRAFDTRFGRIGMLICEDFWHVSPAWLLWMDGADLLIFQSASPGRGVEEAIIGNAKWVQRISETYASTFTNYVMHTNRVGFEDGLNYSGGSFIYDPDGNLVLQAPYHDEGLFTVEVDLHQLRRTRARLPLLRDERIDLTNKELQRILKKGA